jgi:hypothetical protein
VQLQGNMVVTGRVVSCPGDLHAGYRVAWMWHRAVRGGGGYRVAWM